MLFSLSCFAVVFLELFAMLFFFSCFAMLFFLELFCYFFFSLSCFCCVVFAELFCYVVFLELFAMLFFFSCFAMLFCYGVVLSYLMLSVSLDYFHVSLINRKTRSTHCHGKFVLGSMLWVRKLVNRDL